MKKYYLIFMLLFVKVIFSQTPPQFLIKGNLKVKKGDSFKFKFLLPVSAEKTGIGTTWLPVGTCYLSTIHSNKIIGDSIQIIYLLADSSNIDIINSSTISTDYVNIDSVLKVYRSFLSKKGSIIPTNNFYYKNYLGISLHPFTKAYKDSIESYIINSDSIYSCLNVVDSISANNLTAENLQVSSLLSNSIVDSSGFIVYGDDFAPDDFKDSSEIVYLKNVGTNKTFIRYPSSIAALGSKRGGIFLRFDNWDVNSNHYIHDKVVSKYLDAGISIQMAVSINRYLPDSLYHRFRLFQSLGVEMGDIGGSAHSALYFYAIQGMNKSLAGIDTTISGITYIETKTDSSGFVLCSSATISGRIENPNLFITDNNGQMNGFSDTELRKSIFIVYSGINTGLYRNDYYGAGGIIGSYADNSDPDTLFLCSEYFQSISIISEANVDYALCKSAAEYLTVDGAQSLMKAGKWEWKTAGLSPPRVWISPNPYEIERYDSLAVAGRRENYISAQQQYTLQGALKVYGEYNPSNSKQFGMEWDDFTLETKRFTTARSIIADAVAKHYVVANHSHLGAYGLLNDDTTAYFLRIDSLIAFVKLNNILVLTQEEWAYELYNRNQSSYINIIPSLSNDIDSDGVADGFEDLVSGSYFKPAGGLAESDSCRFVRYSSGIIAEIEDLGGLEKGYNEFSFWAKGAVGNFLTVTFTPDFGNSTGLRWEFDSSDWARYDESASENGTTFLSFSNRSSTTDILFNVDTFASDSLSITNIFMAKKRW